MDCCQECPRRFLVVFLGFIGLLVSIGYRTCFALVMVHIVHTNTSGEDTESIWHNCTTAGTGRDLQINWSMTTVFLLHTTYFCGSLVTQLPGGVLAAKFSSKWVCGITILISSILFIVLPFAIEQGMTPLVFAIRIVQGLVEGCSVPALNGVISAWAPHSEKSRLITIAYAGAYLSPAVGLVTTGACACYVSWDSIFFIYGGCGVLWSLVWFTCVYDRPTQHPSLGTTERRIFNVDSAPMNSGTNALTEPIPWRSILTSMPIYAVIVGAFCRNWIFSMLITEQPQYFKDVFGLHAADIGLLSAAPHVLMTLVVITGGVIVDKLITRRYLSTTVARKLSQSIGFGIEAICVMIVGFMNQWQNAFILFCVGVGLSGLAISGYQVNPLDLAPQFTSVLTGLARLGTLGAILSTLVAATLTGDHHMTHDALQERWKHLFIIAASIHLAGVLFYAVFASGNRQKWSQTPALTINFPTPADSDYEEASRETERLLRHRIFRNIDDHGSTTRFLNTI